MAEGGDDGKRQRVLDGVGAPGLHSYLQGAFAAVRAEAASAPRPSGDARVRVLPAPGFASDAKALNKRVQDEGVRPEFARFFGSELDVSAAEWYAPGGPHELFKNPPTSTHEKCTKDKKKVELLKKHAERWLAVYESAEQYRKAEHQAPDATHISQEDEDELEDGDLEVEIVSDDIDDEQ
jgi:hypothetical protein